MKKIILFSLFFLSIMMVSISCNKSCKCYYDGACLIDYEDLMDKSSCQDMNENLDQEIEYCTWE